MPIVSPTSGGSMNLLLEAASVAFFQFRAGAIAANISKGRAIGVKVELK